MNPMNEMVEPYYALINTSRGDKPAVVVVNSALRIFPQRHLFPWHLKIVITCRELAEQGMPTSGENQLLYSIEDTISAEILSGRNGVFLARITCGGTRELLFRICDPKVAHGQLQALVSAEPALREWQYTLEEDVNWHLCQPELRLLESDPRFN